MRKKIGRYHGLALSESIEAELEAVAAGISMATYGEARVLDMVTTLHMRIHALVISFL